MPENSSSVIPVASDHGGFEMKQYLIGKLKQKGYQIKDFGTYSEESVDYPDFIQPLAKAVNDGDYALGIIMCGSGNGAQMTANKYGNIRAALCWNKEITRLARLHNNANILTMPGRFLDFDLAAELAEIFLNTEFEGGRHIRRIEKIKNKE
jgi:ribose 5-phosphate isomerase B